MVNLFRHQGAQRRKLLRLPPFLVGGYANAGWARSVVELYFDRARHQLRPAAPKGTALMTGNRIKMRSNLWTDPRVAMLRDLSGQVEPMVIGGR